MTSHHTTAPSTLTPHEVRDLAEEPVLVDVRTPGEHDSVHVPGSTNLPLDEVAQHVDHVRELVESGRTVVLVCRSGNRAAQAREQLAAQGLDRVPVLDGGLLAWREAGGEVVEGTQRWDLERQVRFVAGGIVAASVAVSTVWPRARYVAGAVGAGLVGAAVTDTCAMGMALSKLSYNRPRSA